VRWIVVIGIAGILAVAILAAWKSQQPEPSPVPGPAPASVPEPPPPTPPQKRTLGAEAGYQGFQIACLGCHGNPDVPRAPAPSVFREMSPEAVYTALTTGTMASIGRQIPDEMKRLIAESATGRPMGTATSGDASGMPNRCAGNPALEDPTAGAGWNGWGADIANTRYQAGPAAGLTPDHVPRLTLRWAFGFPNGLSAWGQPTIASGRIFVGADTGHVYSLDGATGCVYWSFRAKAGIRNAISLGPITGQGDARYAAYFGDMRGSVYALDAQTGRLLWTVQADDHLTARITAAPTLHAGRLYVPVSSWEEVGARNLDYPCCTFRGSVVALDANTGQRIWKTYSIPEEPRPSRKNSKGVQLFEPAGASVFNSPTIDVRRRALYFGTGNDITARATARSDSVIALDLDTGKVLWVYQVTAKDTFALGCNFDHLRTENCPTKLGPDLDIPASPILRTLPGGRRLLVVGTKSGNILALDPDRRGALVWRTDISDGKERNGVAWGGAADEDHVYFGLVKGGVAAIRLATGKRSWLSNPTPPEPPVNHGAAVTAIPGVLFSGGSDGSLYALSTADGRTLWRFDTARAFETVNRVPAKGGGIRAPGPTIAGGILYVGSGYAIGTGDLPGNVLLAFAVKE
jgi:polyvinyl alcohol dehydrogenase (cytochrome)